MILGAQGVFFNAFFCHLFSAGTYHHFLGYVEEEAGATYTRALADKDACKLPLWKDLDAPEIAVAYWHRKQDDEGSSAVRESG
jgi:ubiquinol oxidase